MSETKEAMLARFMRFVSKTETCWLWTGGTSRGYGKFRVGRKQKQASRVAYELMRGPIPEGLQLDHLCHRPICIRPDHLEPVTPSENYLRGFGVPAINARKSHCIRGHPLTGENLAIVPMRGRGPQRRCLACARERNARYEQDRLSDPKKCAVRNKQQRERFARKMANPVKAASLREYGRLNMQRWRARKLALSRLTNDFLSFGLSDHQNLLPGAKAATG